MKGPSTANRNAETSKRGRHLHSDCTPPGGALSPAVEDSLCFKNFFRRRAKPWMSEIWPTLFWGILRVRYGHNKLSWGNYKIFRWFVLHIHGISTQNTRQIKQMACAPPHPGVQNTAGAPQFARMGEWFPVMVHSQTYVNGNGTLLAQPVYCDHS